MTTMNKIFSKVKNNEHLTPAETAMVEKAWNDYANGKIRKDRTGEELIKWLDETTTKLEKHDIEYKMIRMMLKK